MHLANTAIELIDGYLRAHPEDRDLGRHRKRIALSPRTGDGQGLWLHVALEALSNPRCGRFEIGADVLAAAHQVMSTKPASMLAALHRARAPHPLTWVEWITPDDRSASRRGWLILEQEDGAIAIPFASGRPDGAIKIQAYALDIGWDREVRAADLLADPDIAQMVLHHQETASDPAKLKAALEKAAPGSDADNDVAAALTRSFSDEDFAAIIGLDDRLRMVPVDQYGTLHPERGSERIASRLIRCRELIAILLLINSRNAVHVGEGENLVKLNRARERKAKPGLVPLRPVSLDLSRRLRAARRSGGGVDEREVRAHIVRGHFKVRASGVFWWSAHTRFGTPTTPRDYAVHGTPERIP
ncbi:hypothetical protein J2847_002984 [Azospirillum agricola]|uniref:hypothetical protein n=1 Tax=Azospirillum agricola TaxID=1720247 RepID=UPI001AE22F80|nr:hypothetical protein [Azospirillum agricola]MBP2229685.1 hypothetical protein [Azospirillum agricola]